MDEKAAALAVLEKAALTILQQAPERRCVEWRISDEFIMRLPRRGFEDISTVSERLLTARVITAWYARRDERAFTTVLTFVRY